MSGLAVEVGEWSGESEIGNDASDLTTVCCSPFACLPRGVRWSMLDGRSDADRMEPSEPVNNRM